MAAQIGDTHNRGRAKGSESTPVVPYASRGAGLYSEVSWDPIVALRARVPRTSDKDAGPRPASAPRNA